MLKSIHSQYDRQILETSPYGVSIISFSTLERLYVNQKLVELSGANSIDQLISQNIAESYADPSYFDQRKLAIKDGCFANQFEAERIGPNGHKWWARISSDTIMFEGMQTIISWHEDISEKRSIRQSLEQKSIALENVLNNVAQGVVMFDKNRNLISWNKQYIDMLNFPPQMLAVGVSDFDLALFLAERGDYGSGDPVSLVNDRLIFLWKTNNYITEISLENGNIYEVLLTHTDDGGLVITYSDITQQRRSKIELEVSEEKLRHQVVELKKSEARYHAVVENQTEIIARFTPDGIFNFANGAYCRFVGKQQENLVNTSIFNDVPEDEIPALKEYFSSFSQKHPRLSIENQITNATGDLRNFEWSNTATFDEKGNTTEILSVGRDVTERKLAETALHESEEKFRAAFQSNQGTATITDIETGKYIDVNDAWLKLRGFEKHEVIGKTSIELNTWGSNEHRQEVLNELKLHGKLLDYETYVITKAGETREIVINAELVKVSGKDLLFITGSDVTERNQLEKQLRSSQKLEAVGQLTGGIAHDFNNLMAIMMGNLELAMEQVEPDAPLRDNIENALKAVDRGATLTQHLLSFSCQQTLSPAVTNVMQLVEGTLSFMERTLGENIQIVTKHASEESRVNIDATIFGNALVNLALNARDAMPDGGTLTVHTTTVELAGETIGLDKEPTYGSHALITVADTGSGISQDDLVQVLEPFFTTKEVGKGSGLGLSMVFGFVTQSNGHMNIASKEGEGTTISIYLPISTEARADKDNETAPFPEVNTDKTILLVEDDQHVRATTSATLIELGYNVIEAEDGSSALEILSQRSRDIDLVLSDVVMPNGMSGIDLAKQITVDHTHIKILLTSGYPDKIAAQGEIKAMDIELLAKPFRRVQLAAAIENTATGQTKH